MELQDPESVQARSRARDTITESRAFAAPSWPVAGWQLLNTLGPLAGLLVVLHQQPSVLLGLLLSPVLGALVIRVFVLQHDAGHHAFVPSAAANDAIGRALSVITGMPFDAWRMEHRWHHANQGKLHARGVDMVNSPMTVAEARQDPAAARTRAARITPRNVLLFGAWSVVIGRKMASDFFMFRENFPGPLRDPQRLIRSVRISVGAHLLLQVLLAVWIGPLVWLVTAAAAWMQAGLIGAILFWLQHNVVHTWHAGADQWRPVQVALQGSTHLRLPWLLRWLTADIGLHHVHHCNSRIPNYRLRAAHDAIPALRAVPALRMRDIRDSFTHVFWDESRGVMVTVDEALS